MKPIIKQSNKKTSFTIVELLTVMTIVVILFSLLMPSLNMVRKYAKRVKQNAQLHSIAAGLDLFDGDFEGYPDSDPCDPAGNDYCGAMKLGEAMVGHDLLGFHRDSRFREDGLDGPGGNQLYIPDTLGASRTGPYVPVERIAACEMWELYGMSGVGDFDPCSVVLCDEYPRVRRGGTGKRVGMPILYYKADISRILHNYIDRAVSIYNSDDNQDLVDLGLPWDPGSDHPMSTAKDPNLFYGETRDKQITSIDRPYRPDSYILISAGFDGLYGTGDDVFNFDKRGQK